MDHIFENARKLALDLKHSGLYNQYLTAPAEVDSRPELAFLLTEYQRLTRELADVEDSGDGDVLPYRQRVSAAYFAAASHEPLKRFLDAERAVVGLVCDVLDIVAGGCEIEIEPRAKNERAML